jgi:hypothetical protein
MIRQANLSRLLYKSLSILVFSVFVMSFAIKPETVADTKQTPSLPSEERKVEIMKSPSLPSTAPVAINAIRNLRINEPLQNLEIEVQNNSDNPIYYMEIAMFFPDLPKFTGADSIERGVAISLTYGKRELAHLTQRPNSGDVPIQPGEKYTFRIPEPKWKGLESLLAKHNIPQTYIKTLRIWVYTVNFGDGTGLQLGRPYSVKQSVMKYPLPGDKAIKR